jgi:hypothetical protein
LRNSEQVAQGLKKLHCSDLDFDISMSLAGVYLKHSLAMLEATPKSSAKHHVSRQKIFLESLPSKFKREEAIKMAQDLGIKQRTADRHLKSFIDSNKLLHSGHGEYQKTL